MISKIKAFFAKLFRSTFGFLKSKAKIAVDIVNMIKSLVNNESLDFITSLTKTVKDEEILKKVREAVAKVAFKILIAEKLIDESASEEQLILAIIELVKKQNTDVQADFYLVLAGEITKALSDGKISLEEAIAISRLVYGRIIK